jgi:hypothetical protein
VQGGTLRSLFQAKFEHSGVGEAPRRWWPQAISTKVQKYKSTKLTPGFRLKIIAGMTPYLASAGRNLAIVISSEV